MSDEIVRSRLGKGLAALIGEYPQRFEESEVSQHRLKTLPTMSLVPNLNNPRSAFSEAELGELATSIKSSGIIQPIVARTKNNLPNQYEIVAGERRWRAAQLAGLQDVPVLILDLDDKTTYEFALLENIQRVDLTIIEEAHAYKKLIHDYGYTQQDLAELIGKSRVHITNTLRLLALPEEVKEAVNQGRLSAGHARALLSSSDPIGFAEKIVEQNYSVRDVEALVKKARQGIDTSKDSELASVNALTERLSQTLRTFKFSIHSTSKGHGKFVIEYPSLQELKHILDKILDKHDL